MLNPLLAIGGKGIALNRCILIWCSLFMPPALSTEKMHTAFRDAESAPTPDAARRFSTFSSLETSALLYASSLIKFFRAILGVKEISALRRNSMESPEFFLIWIQNLQRSVEELQGQLEALNSSLESLGFEVRSLDTEIRFRKPSR